MKSLAPLRLLGLVVWLAAWSAVAVADCTSPDGQEGTIDYNSTTHQFEYCDETDSWQPLGSVGGSLATLSDVSASAPFDGAVLRYNNSASKWETVDVSTAMSTTTMESEWPDAILCEAGSFHKIMYLGESPNGGGNYVYFLPFGSNYVVFSPDGTYLTHSNMASYDCVTSSKSISTLYSEGRAFNFIGGGSGNSTALGDRITSGTLAVTANSATSIISLSTAGTTWGYLGSGASYLPTLTAGRVSATNISASVLTVNGVNITGAGAASLASLSDVSASAPFDGAVLRYSNSASKWESVDVSTAMSTTSIAPGWPMRSNVVLQQIGSSI